MPELFEAWSILPESDAIWTTILTTWFHTLFVYPTLDHTYVAYIWDLFIVNDFSVFMNLAITIIAHKEKKLSQMNFMQLNNFFKFLPNMKKNGCRLIHDSLALSLRSKYINPCRDLTQFDWHGNGEKKMRKMYKKYKEKQRMSEMSKDIKLNSKSLTNYNLDKNENMHIIDIDDDKEMGSDSSMINSYLSSSMISNNLCTKDLLVVHPILSTLESGEMYDMNDSSADDGNNRNKMRGNNSISISSIESQGCLKNLAYEYKVADDDDVCPSLKNLEYTQDIITDDDDDESCTKSLPPKIYHEMSAPISLITPRISNAIESDDDSDGRISTAKNFIAPFFQAIKIKKYSY